MDRTRRVVAAFALWAAGAAAADAAPQGLALAPTPQGAVPVSALPLRLTGVVVDTTERTRSVCLIRCADSGAGRASVYGIDDRACGLADVREIRDDAVIVRNLSTGALELLPLTPAGAAPRQPVAGVTEPPAPAPAPRPIVAAPAPDLITVALARDTLARYWADLPSLLTSVQATPHYQVSTSGQRSMDGFTIGATTAGSIVEQLGLQTGDVILDVNGEPLDNPAAAMRLLALARDMAQARVRITRQGRPMTVVITVR